MTATIPKPIGNTGYDLLAFANTRTAGITALEAVGHKYPQSKQPLKKAKTFYGYLIRMTRDGYLEMRGHPNGQKYTNVRFLLTPQGRAAGRAWEQGARAVTAPPFPRLAT